VLLLARVTTVSTSTIRSCTTIGTWTWTATNMITTNGSMRQSRTVIVIATSHWCTLTRT
jgi:hypothetical protein